MGTLWPLWSVLSLFFLQLVSLGLGITVTINPNKTMFYSEMDGMPKENITCESDCHVSWKCTYTWYEDGITKHFMDGKILFRDKTIVENKTLRCLVQRPNSINFAWSHQIEVIVKESGAPTRDTDVGIELSGNNYETTSTEKEYGPRNVSIYSSSDLEDLWEGTGNVTLTCKADCNPRCDRYQIYHNEQVLSNTSITSITKNRKHSGKYRCGAYDVNSEEFINSTDVTIKIKYGPKIVKIIYKSDNEDLWEGKGKIALTCSADCNPQCAKFRIYHRGKVISNTSMTSITKDRTNSGKYSCVAYDVKSEGYVSSAKIDIDIKYGPSNIRMNSSSDLEDLWEGRGNFTLTCRADCNPRCDRYRIYHDEQVISNASLAYIENDRKTSGKYRCGAYNEKSRIYVRSAEVDIDIKYGPSNVKLYSSSDLKDLWEGTGKVTLTCRADCKPRCDRYQIYHERQVISNTNVVLIEKVRGKSGKYSCWAYDVKSRRYVRYAEVDIYIKYRTVSLSSNYKEMSQRVNHYLPSNVVCTIECNFQCDSDITVTKNSRSYRIIKSNQSIFSDRKALPSDMGVYRCTSENSQSEDEIKLNILYGPRNTTISSFRKNLVKSEIVLTESPSETHQMNCSSSCNPRCNTTWYKNGELLNYEKHQSMHIRVDRSQSGTYRCEANGIEGKQSSDEVKIIVQYPPGSVEVKPSNTTFYSRSNGKPITDITCEADCLPKCDYVWYALKRTWSYFYKYWYYGRAYFTSGTALFADRNFTNDHSRFQCAASNSLERKFSTMIIVEVKDGPDDVRINAIRSPRENQPFELQCSARCDHGCLSYTWHHKKQTIHNGSNLNFNNLMRKNNGEYTCKVKDYFGTASKKYSLNVQFGPTNVRIKYTYTGQNLVEYSYGSVHITCQAECNPACSYKLYRKGQQIGYRRGSLWISKTKENSGRYSCSADNSLSGPIHSSNFVDILIQYKPKLRRFEIIPVDIKFPGFINLTFEVDSFPPSNVTIVFYEKMLRFANVTGLKSYKIEITSCLDEREVKIIAKNNIGSDKDTKRITTKCSPMILTYSNVSNKGFNIGDPLNLTTTFIAYPAADVSWSFASYKSRNVSQKVEESLINNKKMTSIIVDSLREDNFGIYQLTLANDIGNETLSFSIKGPPQSPTELTLDCLSAAFLEWKPGFDGGTDQSFLIEYTTNISSPWSPQSELSITSKDNDRMSTYVNLMNPKVRYFFRVVSENVFGRVISDKIVNCTLQAVGEEESFLSVDTIAGISGGLVLILVATIVLVLFGVKKYQNHHRQVQKARKQNAAQEEDCGMGMIENTLYISGDDVNNSTILSSKYQQNDAVNTKSRNDVYSVVKKTEKIEPDFPMYAEVCKSRPVKDKPAIKKKPAKKTKNSTGKTVNKDGLVYVEIDLKNTPALSGNPVIHGSDNKTLYVDIDFTQYADPLPECDVEDTDDANLNEKKQQE